MDAVTLRQYETLSPFEIKNDLARVAAKSAKRVTGRVPERRAREPELDRDRAAFGVLPARAVRDHREPADDGSVPGVGGMPKRRAWPRASRPGSRRTPTCPGRRSCSDVIPWAVRNFGFDADAFVHELVDSIIGDNYPVPDRMLVHNEQIVREYLQWAMCGEPRPAGTFHLYAVEGGTAAMCYLFKSLKANRLLNPGDTIAMATPIFTPYLEMPHLEDYGLKTSPFPPGRSSAGSTRTTT